MTPSMGESTMELCHGTGLNAPVSVPVLLVLFFHLLPVPGETEDEEQNSTCANE